jgi:hypothetical protein
MEQIFLEPNEEITSVIDKLAGASGGKVALVVPKNSTLFQSLVNLKLLAKQARELNREVVLITGNKVGQRLATQVGIETYATMGTIRDAASTPTLSKSEPVQPAVSQQETLPDGTPIRRYVPPSGRTETATAAPVTDQGEPSESPKVTEPSIDSAELVAPTVPIIDSSTPTDREVTEVVADEPAQETRTHAQPEPPAELPTIISRAPTQRRELHFELPWKSLVAAGVLLIVAFALTYVLLPKATLTVTLPAKAVSEDLELAIISSTEPADSSIPGKLLSVDKSLTKPIAATGKKDIGTKASGSVAFKNCEDTQSRSIPAGSKVTASAKTFTTNAALTIPAGSFSGGGTVCSSSAVNVTVTAESAGEAHNLSNATFTINGQSTRVSGTGTTTGGTTKQVTVLTQDDINKGLADLDAQASTEANAELATKAEGQTIIEGSITQTPKTRTSDKKVGDQTDAATVTLVTTVSAIVFDKALVEAKVQEALVAKIEAGQRLEIPADQPITFAFKEYNTDKTSMTIVASGRGFGVSDISRGELAQAVKHMSRAGASERLKADFQATEVKIDLYPGWWMDRLPVLSSAITVEYGFSEVVPTPETPAP